MVIISFTLLPQHLREFSLGAQTALRGVVALRYQHHHSGVVNTEGSQLHATLSEPLDYRVLCYK